MIYNSMSLTMPQRSAGLGFWMVSKFARAIRWIRTSHYVYMFIWYVCVHGECIWDVLVYILKYEFMKHAKYKLLKISLETQVWLIIYHLILYFQHYNWYHKKACLIAYIVIPHLLWLCNYGIYSTAGYEWRSEMKSCNSFVLPSRETPFVFILQWVWTIASTQCFARFHFWLSIKTSCSVLSIIS